MELKKMKKLNKSYLKWMSQNYFINKLDHTYLMILKGSIGMYVKETIRVRFRKTQVDFY